MHSTLHPGRQAAVPKTDHWLKLAAGMRDIRPCPMPLQPRPTISRRLFCFPADVIPPCFPLAYPASGQLIGTNGRHGKGSLSPPAKRLLQGTLILCLGCTFTIPSAMNAAVRVIQDVSYLEPTREEKLDLYLPDPVAPGQLRPAIILVHGGGWIHGNKTNARETKIANSYATAGYVCAIIEYQLGPGAWPTNLHDCKNAVRFMRHHASQFQIDPARIAIHGNSAGGHLALMVALTAGEPDLEPTAPYPGLSSRALVAIDFYGPADFLASTPPGPDGTPRGNTDYFPALTTMLGASKNKNPELWKAASPITHVTAAAPAILIVHGLSDSSVDYFQSISLANELRAHGMKH